MPRQTAPHRPDFRRHGVRAGAAWRRLLAWAAALVVWINRRRTASHVGTHLAWVVLLTGGITFAVVGVVALTRLKADAIEQAASLTQLSRRQTAQKLDGEARLAEARLRVVFDEAQRQTRYLSERQDLTRTLTSANNVAIQQVLQPAGVTGELDALLVTDMNGTVIGASRSSDLLAAGEAVAKLGLKPLVDDTLANSRRSDRRAHRATVRLTPAQNASLGTAIGRPLAHVAVEPVFDDFGDVIGTLLGFRALAPSERTFELFSKLVNAGVVVSDNGAIVSTGGDLAPGFRATTRLAADDLITDPSVGRIGRCVEHDTSLLVCAHVPVSEIEEAQEAMLQISERQARTLFMWFFALGAGALGLLVAVVLVSVRRATRGLPELASAASAVAKGELDVPFRALGIGEVRGLGHAFEVMLANLRDSMGRIRELAFYDPITGTANRAKLRLDGTELLAERPEEVVFLFVDLDRFKSVNDTFGHKIGDELLVVVSGRLRSFFEHCLETGGIADFRVGRLGGDEFLVILRGALGADELKAMGEQLIGRIGENIVLGTAHITVGASIGIARGGLDGDDYDTLLISSDVAMYEAKRAGRNSCAFFTTATAQVMQERLAIEQELRLALKDGGLTVVYQPMISLDHGKVVGAEALVRWFHPERGNISPAKFIAIAEDAGLIGELGQFVLRRAVEETVGLVRGSEQLTIAVNVSVLQLEDPTFAASVETCLAEVGFPLNCLEIEITESIAMRASDLVQGQIAHLRQLGVRFSIDDFGTGYSNLSMLAGLQVDTLKIDRSLVSGVQSSVEQQAIVQSILSLARSLGFSTVVEGVETVEDLEYVMGAGAAIAQGFFFSRAVTIDAFRAIQDPGSLRQLVRRKGTSVALLPGRRRQRASKSR